MTHFDFRMEEWQPVKDSRALAIIRLSYSAALAMIVFFVSTALSFFLPFATMLPFMTASLICWVVLGSAARRNRKGRGIKEFHAQ